MTALIQFLVMLCSGSGATTTTYIEPLLSGDRVQLSARPGFTDDCAAVVEITSGQLLVFHCWPERVKHIHPLVTRVTAA